METMEERLSWYRKALEEVDGFLSTIDPYLEVRVIAGEVEPLPEFDHGEGTYNTLALSFSSRADPRISWSMMIRYSDEYLKNELRHSVERAFTETLEGLVDG